MNGYQAYDELLRSGMMVQNQDTGWAMVTQCPKNKRDLGFLVRCISLMAAFDNQIERSRSGEPDNLMFRKRKVER